MKILIYCFLLFFVAPLFSTVLNVPDQYASIQDGINESINGDTVLVQPGTYFENINLEGKNILLTSLFTLNQDSIYIDQTIINGSQNGSVITIENEEDSTCIISGFTITNGSGTPDYDGVNLMGGGIIMFNSSPTLSNLKVTNNNAAHGGGIYCGFSSNPTFDNLQIINNNAEEYGGGFHFRFCSATIMNSIIENNASDDGGGILNWSSNIVFENTLISDNISSGCGGGLYTFGESSYFINSRFISNHAGTTGGAICSDFDDESIFINVLLTENTAELGGGAISCFNVASPIFINATISDNSSNSDGGCVISSWGSNPIFTNSIMWNNYPNEIYLGYYEGYTYLTVSYSDVQGGESEIIFGNECIYYWLEGNISENPLFTEEGAYAYSCDNGSPCIDSGTMILPNGIIIPEYDLAGNPRIYGDSIDMGAYEWQGVESEDDQIIISKTSIWNYPNPFNPETKICFSLESSSNIELIIFNSKGQKVKSILKDYFEPGSYSTIWNGENESGDPVSSGIYCYKLKTEYEEFTAKCILLK